MLRRARLVAAVGFACAMGSAMSSASAAGCKLATLDEWPVRIERNLLLVEGALNGQPARIMLDTGAARTLLLPATAMRLNVTRTDLKRDRAFGETKIEIAYLDEFRVGEFKRAPWRMMIAGNRDFAADVLLGEDFLSLVDLEFDLEHNAVRLFQPENCDGKKLAYWAAEGQSVGDVAIDAILATNPQIVLDVAINGQSVSALLASGAALSALDKPAAARLGVTPETPGVVVSNRNTGMGAKSLPVWNGPFATFTIGNETIKDARIQFSDLFQDANYAVIGSHIRTKVDGLQQMLLGVDFLRSHRVLVSHSQRRIYFTHNGGPVFGLPPGSLEARGETVPATDLKPAAAAN
jgi:predicted aspartyl protease